MLTVAKQLNNNLVKAGFKKAFIYSGGAIMPLIDCLSNKKIDHYVSSNEFCSGSSALAYARITGKTGLCITTSGPGITNCVTPILDAKCDGVPLLVLSGQVPLKAMGSDAFQEAPSTEITKSITKWNYLIKDPNEIDDVLKYAIDIANHRKKGPVHIDLPKCVLTSDLSDNYQEKSNFNLKLNNDIIYKPTKELYNEISKTINNSKRPVVYAGKGCINASKELREFVKKGNLPITTTLLGLGCYEETDDLSLQMVGMHGSNCANMAIQNSDCIIAIGSRFDDRTTGDIKRYAPKAKNIIHINIEPTEINKVVKSNLNLQVDCKEALQKLCKNIIYKRRQNWINTLDKWKEKKFTYDINNKLKAQQVIETLDELIIDKSNYVFCTGIGNHQMYTAQFIKFTEPNQLITSGSLGVMGTCLPYAIGMKLGIPDKEIIGIDGDGSFHMSLNDLITVKKYNIPIKMIIMNNSSQDMVRCWEDLFFGKRNIATPLDNPSFVDIAKQYGIKTIKLNKKKDLKKKINKFLELKGPVLMEAIIEKDFCFPLVKPGSALNDMVFDLDNDFEKSTKNVPN